MKAFPKHLRPIFAKTFNKLSTPAKIQDFLNSIPSNFEKSGDTCYSPLLVLEKQTAHCMEGALFAAAALWYHGENPILLDLKTSKDDESHVVTLFQVGKNWGAISKTNHSVLRYRDPVYKSIRELAMSYFHEYFLHSGKKTLESFAGPFSLLHYDSDWLTSREYLFNIVNDIDSSPHTIIIPKSVRKNLRRADPIEIKAGKITQWKR